MDNLARKPPEEGGGHYTYADYKSWELAEGERCELIGGAVYAMAAPNDQHQAVCAE